MPGYRFSKKSLERLRTCHGDLQELFQEVIKHCDCIIIRGHRGEEEQDKAFRDGFSKLKYPNSKHNGIPSMAVDVATYPIRWDDTLGMYIFAGFVKGIATEMGIKIRIGADWDGDFRTNDQKLNDLVHFELI